jgi:Fur family ferric uptake transcriptional regulator
MRREMKEQEIIQELRKNGYKLTKARQAVIRVLAQNHQKLTAQQILEKGKEEDPRLGLVTVYRTLELLSEIGVAKRLHGDTGCHSYALSEPGEHKHYLICKGCGAVIEFEGYDEIESFLRKLERDTGFQITDHWLQVFGYCPRCRNQNKTGGEK